VRVRKDLKVQTVPMAHLALLVHKVLPEQLVHRDQQDRMAQV